MNDRDKAYLLKELTRTIDESDSTAAFCLCQRWILKDALALLKEQEAHVLTLDEAVDGNHVYYVEFQYHLDRGWVKCDFDKIYVNGEVAMLFLHDKTFYQQKEHYGQLWRLWSNRPTYEQMKAVKWE